jgi:hypothetical protein
VRCLPAVVRNNSDGTLCSVVILDFDDATEAECYADLIRRDQSGERTMEITGPSVYTGDTAVKVTLFDDPADAESVAVEVSLRPSGRITDTFVARGTVTRLMAAFFYATYEKTGSFSFTLGVKGEPRWELLTLIKYTLRGRVRPPLRAAVMTAPTSTNGRRSARELPPG